MKVNEYKITEIFFNQFDLTILAGFMLQFRSFYFGIYADSQRFLKVYSDSKRQLKISRLGHTQRIPDRELPERNISKR